MQNVILLKQTLLYSTVETRVKFVKARSHGEIQTPTRLVVKMGENRHFSILQLQFYKQSNQVDGKRHSC